MRWLLSAWWLLLPLFAAAQEEMIRVQEDPLPFTLKISTLELINPWQEGVIVHADLPLTPRWALDLGAGPILYSWAYNDHGEESYRGMKWQSAVKYFLRRDNVDTYLSLSYKYIDVDVDRFTQLLRQGRQYTEWQILRRRKVTHGGALLFGAQYYVGRKERCVIEVVSGIGIRVVRVTAPNLPADADILRVGNNTVTFDPLQGTYRLGGPILGLHIGWVLNRKWR